MVTGQPKLIVLDRDGVINEDSDDYIKSPEEWIPVPGSAEAIAKLKQKGYLVAVATNQSGIARGYYDLATLQQIHQKMRDHIRASGGEIDAIFFCPHGPDDGCDCRKPKAGLLNQVCEHFQTQLDHCYLVGDSQRDLEAGLQHQCQPILVRTGKGERTLAKGLPPELQETPVYKDLLDFVNQLP